MKCPECAFENKPDAARCTHCGVRLGPLPPASTSLNRFEEEPVRASGALSPLCFPLQIETEISPRTRIFIFSGIFYGLLLSYVAAALVSPSSPYAQLAAVFHSFWANFLLLVLLLVAATFCLYFGACFCCKRMLKTPWGKPKLGKVILQHGYLRKEELEEALEEQKLRIGEILVQNGRLTLEQLNESLERQKQVSRKLGEVLIELGFSTQQEVDWALDMMERRLGEILREKGLLRDEDIEWLLGQQEFGLRRI